MTTQTLITSNSTEPMAAMPLPKEQYQLARQAERTLRQRHSGTAETYHHCHTTTTPNNQLLMIFNCTCTAQQVESHKPLLLQQGLPLCTEIP